MGTPGRNWGTVGGEARRRAIERFIREFARTRGYPPTVREIAAGVGLRSIDSTYHHLRILAVQGRIAMEPMKTRTIRVMKGEGE